MFTMAATCFQDVHTTSFVEGPTEPMWVGDVATSKAPIGLQIFLRKVRATHSENPATATLAGLVGKAAWRFLPWTNSRIPGGLRQHSVET